MVIITEEKGIGSEIAERCEQEGREVIRAIRGSHFFKESDSRYTINTQEAGDYIALLREVGDSPGLTVLHCLSVSEQGADEEARIQQGEESFYSLIYLAQG